MSFRTGIAAVAFVCVAAGLTSCGSSTQGAIPIEKFPVAPTPTPGQYVIDAGDVLNVQVLVLNAQGVFEQDKMSGKMRVRSDGRISMALLNEILAAGKTPEALKTEIETALKKTIINPQVTITVEESSPLSISILGEVNKNGPIQLPRGSGVAQAIAAAGGLTTFADRDKIFVNRTTPKPVRIHFTYDQLTRSVGPAATFQLQSGDVIVVE
jgi:polysaccharide biosynthesis/export protein